MYGAQIVCSVNNIPTAYDTTAGSLIILGSSAGKAITFINKTGHVIAFCVGAYDDAPDSGLSLNRNQGFVDATTSVDQLLISTNSKVFVRTVDTPATTGALYVFIWGL